MCSLLRGFFADVKAVSKTATVQAKTYQWKLDNDGLMRRRVNVNTFLVKSFECTEDASHVRVLIEALDGTRGQTFTFPFRRTSLDGRVLDGKKMLPFAHEMQECVIVRDKIPFAGGPTLAKTRRQTLTLSTDEGEDDFSLTFDHPYIDVLDAQDESRIKPYHRRN